MASNTEILILFLTPVVVVLLFQISSYLNMTLFSTEMTTIEIEDFCKLTGLEEGNILMIPCGKVEVKFKILNNVREEIAEVTFDLESLKIKEAKNIEIDSRKLNDLRRIKFSNLLRIPSDKIKISEDGNTFTEIENDSSGKEIVNGSVTFSEANLPIEVTGKFKKYF